MSSTPPQTHSPYKLQLASPESAYLSTKGAFTDISDSEGDEYFSDATEGLEREDEINFTHELDLQTPIASSFPAEMSNNDIPTVVVDQTEDDHPVHGTVPGTEAFEKRKADAKPDEVNEYQDSHTTTGIPRLDTDVPMVILEKTPDDYQPYGSIPGTPAYNKRAADSVPDEIHIRDTDLPATSPARSRSASIARARAASISREHSSPNLEAVPQLILEKVDDAPSYGQVPGTSAYDKRKADASPDRIIQSPSATPTHSRSPSRSDSNRMQLDQPVEPAIPSLPSPAIEQTTTNDDDEFDDFGETQEAGEGDFDDFGDFNDATTPAPVTKADTSAQGVDNVRRPYVPDFTGLSGDEIKTQVYSMISGYYPTSGASNDKVPPLVDTMFQSERSLSLWSQLSAPPPLQPPNWKLSRIRRLFLVSLGVPVDLDEILPAETKQKKLVLPSANSSRKSVDVNRSSQSDARRRKKEDSIMLVDVPAARILCSTSDVKMRGFTEEELREHIKRLDEVTREASDTLTYWLAKRDSAISDKETFEGVIENLIMFTRKGR